jgi:hypothetical protein
MATCCRRISRTDQNLSALSRLWEGAEKQQSILDGGWDCSPRGGLVAGWPPTDPRLGDMKVLVTTTADPQMPARFYKGLDNLPTKNKIGDLQIHFCYVQLIASPDR